jgi:hypothetical protein
MFVCYECCVLSGRGLCNGLIIRPDESYRLWCVGLCESRNLVNEEAMAHCGLSHQKQTIILATVIHSATSLFTVLKPVIV